MKKTPRKYQVEMIQELSLLFSKGAKRLCAQLSTGGGKTFTFAEIIRRIKIKSPDIGILVAVHRDKLRKQAQETIFEHTGFAPLPITRNTKKVIRSDVYVAMVDSLGRRKPDNVGLVILDECHVGNMRKVLDMFPDALFIGVTATPISSNKKFPLKDYYEDIVCGPDTPDLIELGALVQNMTICPTDIVKRRELTLKNGEFDENYMAEKFSAPRFINNTVSAYKKHFDGKKNIVFNVNVEHSKKVNEAFRLAGYKSMHIDGTMDERDVQAAFHWFENTPGSILNNVGIAVAGIDIPSIEVVTLNFSTTSVTKFLQCCGRGSRPDGDYKNYFGILDMGGNAAELQDWNERRDWKKAFFEPKKGPNIPGIAPKKNCPECDALIAAQALTCPFCEADLRKQVEDEVESILSDYMVITKGISVESLVANNGRRKKYYPFFEIGRRIAQAAPKDERVFDAVYKDYLNKVNEWCQLNSIKYTQWHEAVAKEHLEALMREN